MIVFNYKIIEEWPPLAWAAKCTPGNLEVQVYHGNKVEVRDEWFCEAVWDGAFEAGEFDKTDLVFGSGGHIRDNQVVFVSSGCTLDRLQSYFYTGGAWVSNSLACLLTVVDVKLDITYPAYFEHLGSIVQGLDKYQKDLKVSTGNIQLTYFNNLKWDGTALEEIEKPNITRNFSTFKLYYAFLQNALRLITENMADVGRKRRYELVGTLSSGYDSPTVTVLAQPFGLHEVISLAEARGGDNDDGREIANHLGIKLRLIPREAWQKRPLAEVPFIAADAKGEDIYMSGAEEYLKGKVLLTGHGLVWAKDAHSLKPTIARKDRSGLSLTEYRLWADFIHLPIPFMAVRQIKDINAISNSPEMAPWDVGGDYNKPICRRIVEEAGVPRNAFGVAKKAASVLFGARGEALSPVTLQTYYKWLQAQSSEWISTGKVPPAVPAGLSQQTRNYYKAMLRGVSQLAKLTPPMVQSKVNWLTQRLAHDKNAKNLMRYTFPWAIEKAKERYSAYHKYKK